MQKQCLMKYKVVCDNALNVMQENWNDFISCNIWQMTFFKDLMGISRN